MLQTDTNSYRHALEGTGPILLTFSQHANPPHHARPFHRPRPKCQKYKCSWMWTGRLAAHFGWLTTTWNINSQPLWSRNFPLVVYHVGRSAMSCSAATCVLQWAPRGLVVRPLRRAHWANALSLSLSACPTGCLHPQRFASLCLLSVLSSCLPQAAAGCVGGLSSDHIRVAMLRLAVIYNPD